MISIKPLSNLIKNSLSFGRKIEGLIRTPKIGLALGGGSAWGIAHIGVLKAIEEYKIPIGCISGTSVGALIGGLYALGVSVSDLIDLAHKTH